MADPGFAGNKRDPIKSSVGNAAASRRRQHAVTVGKERRESLVRAKRLCRVGVGDDGEVSLVDIDGEMMIDEEEQSILESQTSLAVENLKSALAYQGKGAMQKRVGALQEIRRLLSRSEFPPVGSALKAGAVPILVQCLSFGSPDEQLLEAAWCLTNIAAGNPEETKALLPALPMLIAHLGEVFRHLYDNKMIAPCPANPVEPPYPQWYDPNAKCEYHAGAIGHSTENCRALKFKVQNLIDRKWLTFKGDGPNVGGNPLPGHSGSAVNAVEEFMGQCLIKNVEDIRTPLRDILIGLR